MVNLVQPGRAAPGTLKGSFGRQTAPNQPLCRTYHDNRYEYSHRFTSSFKYLKYYFRSGPRQLEARELSAELALISCPQCLVLTTKCFTFLASLKMSPDTFCV